MAELLDVLDAFSNPLKIGWVMWVAWGVGQVFWYRHERRPQGAPPRHAIVEKEAAPAPAVPRLITAAPAIETLPPVAPEVPVFDPSTAVVETFAAPSNDLDSFVAEFEMRSQRRRNADPTVESSYGAEASQTH